MSRCTETIDVSLGEGVEAPETVRCELDAGHDDPAREIGGLRTAPFHRWEYGEWALHPDGTVGPTPSQLTIAVTWRTT